jgi:hypothetical protein
MDLDAIVMYLDDVRRVTPNIYTPKVVSRKVNHLKVSWEETQHYLLDRKRPHLT